MATDSFVLMGISESPSLTPEVELIEIHLFPGWSEQFRDKYTTQAREIRVLPGVSQSELSGCMPSAAGTAVLQECDSFIAGGYHAHHMEHICLRSYERGCVT